MLELERPASERLGMARGEKQDAQQRQGSRTHREPSETHEAVHRLVGGCHAGIEKQHK